MPIFEYLGKDKGGGSIKGEIVAGSKSTARMELVGQGIYLVSIRKKSALWNNGKVKDEDRWAINHKLIALFRAGMSIKEVLIAISESSKNAVIRSGINEVMKRVEDGVPFSEAAKSCPALFDELFIAMLVTAEKTGDLVSGLLQYQENFRRRMQLKRQVINASIYPIFLLFALLLIVSVLMVFVLPRFVSLYDNMDAQLPMPTMVMLSLVGNFPVICVVVITLVVVSAFYIKRNRSLYDWLYERVVAFPIIGSYFSAYVAAYIAMVMSSMLSAGATVVEAIENVEGAVNNSLIKKKMKSIRFNVVQGSPLASAMLEENIFPDLGIELISVGEKTGRLPEVLKEIADYYSELLNTRMTRMASLVEPTLMLIMGVVVGAIIITMYLPIFSLVDVIK